MSLKTLLSVNAIVGLVFGLALLFAPGILLATYGLGTDGTTLLIARLLGAEFLGYNVVSLLVRNQVTEPRLGRSFVIARFLSEGLGFVVALLARLAGMGNSTVWTVVGLYALFTLGYLYFLVRGQSAYGKA